MKYLFIVAITLLIVIALEANWSVSAVHAVSPSLVHIYLKDVSSFSIR